MKETIVGFAGRWEGCGWAMRACLPLWRAKERERKEEKKEIEDQDGEVGGASRRPIDGELTLLHLR